MEILATLEVVQDIVSYLNSIWTQGAAQLPLSSEQETIIKTIEECSLEEEYTSIVSHILAARNMILQYDHHTDIEGCFKMLSIVLFRCEDAEVLGQAFVDGICDTNDDKATLRLRILVNFFNTIPAKHALRYTALLTIIRFAAASNNYALIQRFMASIDTFFGQNELSNVKSTALYLEVLSSLETNDIASDDLEYLQFLVLYFQSNDNVSDALDVAVKAVRRVITNPIPAYVGGIDLMEFKAVQQLKNDAKYKNLYALLEVMCSKNLEEFIAFHKSNANVFSTFELNFDECFSNMRMLALCAMPVTSESIPYSKIMEILQIEEGEVEQWVIKAMTNQLIEARIDQLQQNVTISHRANRQFGDEQWEQLGTKLQAWKDNIATLLEKITTSREEAANVN